MSAQIYGKEFAYRKKTAIQAPWAKYFSEDRMIEYINDVVVPGMKKRNWVNVDSFLKRLENLQEGNNVVNVWKYVSMELWCQFFIDGRTEFYK